MKMQPLKNQESEVFAAVLIDFVQNHEGAGDRAFYPVCVIDDTQFSVALKVRGRLQQFRRVAFLSEMHGASEQAGAKYLSVSDINIRGTGAEATLTWWSSPISAGVLKYTLRYDHGTWACTDVKLRLIS
jgi:hypothetical protein